MRPLRGERSDPPLYLAHHPRFSRQMRLRISALPLRHADGRIRGSVITVVEEP